jgi:predicted RNA-binding Zn ribbon-like protein
MIAPDDFVAGALSLDFVNTVAGTRAGVHNDKFERYDDLLEWAVVGDAITRPHADKLVLIAHRRPEMTARTMGEAKALRESLYAIFFARLKREALPAKAFEHVNRQLGEALSHACLKYRAHKYEWGWEPPELLDAPLWPVVHDAGELLTSDSLERLRECASETCGWLFLDLTKNRSRRWCAMNGCGNRDKLRRFRERHG